MRTFAVFGIGMLVACAAQPLKRQMPKLIWSYQETEFAVSDLAERCVNNWRRMNPDYIVHVYDFKGIVSELNVKNPELVPVFSKIRKVQHRADWVRLYTLARHGGYWLDGSVFLTQPLDKYFRKLVDDSGENQGVMYYLDAWSDLNVADYGIMETYFIAVLPHNAFIRAWFHEFNNLMMLSNGEVDGHEYARSLRERLPEDRYNSIVQRIPHNEAVGVANVTIALVGMKVLLEMNDNVPIIFLCAENQPYKLQTDSNSSGSLSSAISELAKKNGPSSLPPIVKLARQD